MNFSTEMLVLIGKAKAGGQITMKEKFQTLWVFLSGMLPETGLVAF